jgi:hypothetical protein
MRVSEHGDDICIRLDPEITMKVTISNVAWCVDSIIQHFVLIALNDNNIRIIDASAKWHTIPAN